MSGKSAGGLIVGVGVLIGVPLALIFSLLLIFATPAGACGTPGQTATVTPTQTVAGYGPDQLTVASAIINEASRRGLSTRAQVIGVMTAMDESGLRALSYGDYETSGMLNPDGTPTTSVGPFQQQESWGTLEQRINPTSSAGLFYDRLVKVNGWETMEPTIAIHTVQVNQDPNVYAKFQQPAEEVVAALTNGNPTALAATCTAKGNYPSTGVHEPGPWGGFQNGRIDEGTLTTVPWDQRHRLRADATDALIAMNAQFRSEFGYDLPINDGYRDYPNQVKARQDWCGRGNCNGAADPGTSTHGWALAIDIGDRSHRVISYNSLTYAWLKTNANTYGWIHPDWAEPNGRGPHEAWHWEYQGTP